VIGEAGGHGRGARVPRPWRVGGGESAEAVVGPAEVVGRADQPHAGGESRPGASDGATATGERREVGAAGGVEALDVGRVDHGAGRRRGQHRLDAGQGALDDAAGDPACPDAGGDMALGGVFDNPSASSGQALGELEAGGQHQPWTTTPPGPDRLAEDVREGGDVAGQAPSFLGAS